MADRAAPPGSPPKRPKRRRWIYAAGTLGGVLGLGIGLRWLVTTDPGRGFVEARVEALSPAGQRITIDGLDGDVLGRFTVDRLTVSDASGNWLIAEDVELDWSPWGLLRRRVVVDLAEIRTLAIPRQPELVSSSSGARTNGSPPIRGGALGSLVITRLETGPDLTGEAAVFAVDASAEIDQAEWSVDAALVPANSGGDRVDVDLSWSAGDVMQGQATLNAPAGGLIATLARLEPDQPLAARLNASGTVESWQVTGNADIGDTPLLSLEFSGANDAIRGAARVDLAPHPLTRPFASRIGDTVEITANQVEREGRNRLSVQAVADGMTVAMGTDAALRDAPITLVASLPDAGAMLGVEGLDADLVRLSFETRQAPGDWSLSGDVSLDGVETPLGTIATVAGPLEIALSDGPPALSLALEARGATLDGPTGALLGSTPALRLSGNLSGDGEAITVDTLRLSGRHAALSADGTYNPGENALDIRGMLRADGVASGALPIDLSGAWRTVTGDGGRPEIRFSGQVTGFTDLPPDIATLVGEQVDLTVVARPEADGGITVPRAELSAGAITATGSAARRADGTITAALDGTVTAEALGPATLAPLDISLTAEGPLDALNLLASVATETISAAGQTLRDTQATFDGTLADTQSVTGRFRVTGTSDQGPVSLLTDVSVDPSTWALDDVAASAFGLELSGRAGADLADLSSLQADLSLAGAPSLGAQLERINAEVALLGDRIDVRANASLAPLSELGPGEAVLRASGTRDELAIEASFDADLYAGARAYPLIVKLDGTAEALTSPQSRLTLSPTVALADLVSETIRPVMIERDAEAGTLTGDGEIGLLNGTLAFDLDAAPDLSRLSVRHDGVALAPLLALLERPVVGGTLSGNLSLQALADASVTRVSATGTLSGLAPANQPDEAVTLTYTVEGDADRLVAAANATDDGTLDLTARLTAPLDATDGWPGLMLEPGAGATYAIAGDGDIDAFTALALPASMAASGMIDVTLTGTIPGIVDTTRGEISLRNGQVEQGDLGFMLEDLSVDVQVDDGILSLHRFNGTGRAGGTLSGEGTYSLSNGPTSPATTLMLTANALSVIDRDDVKASSSGTLTLDETEDGFAIRGDLTIDRADIDPTQIEGAGYKTLDVTFRDAETPAPQPAEDAVRLSLDINVDAPRRIFIEGQGLDAELRLNASITGPAGAPVIVGEAEIVRGRFDFAGKRFVFEDSRIVLARDLAESELDLRAVRQASDIQAVITITGTPSAPEIALSSEPDLPEDEILSRVLFGRSPTELSELEALQLASSLASLSGSGGGFNIMGDIEDALGLDALDLSRNEDGGTDVTTGKYLSEDVYLQVRSDGIGQPTLIIEWTPRDNIEIEADLTPTEGQGASVEWQREFD